MDQTLVGIYFTALIASTASAGIIHRIGHRIGLTDKPNARSSHRRITPKGGGVGILLAFVIVAITYYSHIWFWLPATVLSLLSLCSDRFEISPVARLTIQFAASMILLAGIGSVDVSPVTVR